MCKMPCSGRHDRRAPLGSIRTAATPEVLDWSWRAKIATAEGFGSSYIRSMRSTELGG
jgi:hypothetical protein